MAPRRVVCDIPLHKAGTRVQLLWWPGGRLVTLCLGQKQGVLDARSAKRLRDALSQYLEQGAQS